MQTENNIVTLPTAKPSVLVELHNKQAVTTSLKVAELFDKEHKDVLKAIRNLECSGEFHERNFALTQIDFLMPTGGIRKDPAYNITKNGFVFLAMGFTGEKAAQFKEAYINEFDRMEKQLLKLKHLPRPKSPQDIFVKHHKAACLIFKERNDRLRYANQKTLEETGFDILADAGLFLPNQHEILGTLLNKTIDDRSVKQLLDAVHYQQLGSDNASQILLAMYIRVNKGVLYVARKCPLLSKEEHDLLKTAQGAVINTPVYFKGHGTCRSTVIELY